MGPLPHNHQQWTDTIAKHCPELDDEIVTYLASVAIDEPSTKQVAVGLAEAFHDYDAASDREQAQHLCQLIFNDLGIKPTDDDAVANENEEDYSDEIVESVEELSVGQKVVCRHGSDNMWYSGSVLRCTSDEDVVVWIDRFNQEVSVPVKCIRVDHRNGLKLSDLASGFTSEKDKRISMRDRIAKDATKIVESMRDDKKKVVKEEKQRVKAEKEAEYKRKLAVAQLQADRDSQTAMQLKVLALQAASKSTGCKDVVITSFSLPALGGGSDLLVDAALRFASGRRYGLCGRNGIGKSTLLKAIASYEVKGFPMNVRVLYVEQEVRGSDTTVLDWVLSADIERQALLEEEAKLTDDPNSAERLSEIYDRLRDIDAWGAEARASSILSGLQFTPEMQQLPTRALSGGWRMRVALATALFLRPDLLLLDEPTNHLDFPAVLWLEKYLCDLPSTLVVVSHDRVFINNVVTDIVHQENRTLAYYKGNYENFEKTCADTRKQQHKLHEANDRKRRHMQSFIDRFRYNANRARLVQSRIKAMERLGVVDDVEEDSLFRFDFPDPEPLQKHIIQFDDAVFDYKGDTATPLLSNVNIRLDMESRVGVIGANGCGKTTLVKLMTGELSPLSGYVWINPNARIEVFTQHHVDQLDLGICALEYFRKMFPQFELQQIRSHLGRFGVGGDLATQTIGTLSGGQKSRVAFAKITVLKPHLIIMDEPTNHMDLETVDTLLNALSTFGGGALLISHDQHFLMNVATEYWSVSNGKVTWLESFEAAKSHTYANL